MKIEARVAGSQPMIVNWYKDDKEIFSSDRYDITFKSNMAVMVIKSSSTSDSGTYTCKVTNEAGSASCQVLAHISGAFFFFQHCMHFLLTVVNLSSAIGQSVNYCRYVDIILTQPFYSFIMVCVYYFHDAERKVPPSFDLPLKPVTLNEGETLSLSCHVRGTPPLKIEWMKDRRELKSSANTKITFVDGTATLVLLNVSKTDAGDYLCKATNEAGSEFCKSRVTIKGISFLTHVCSATCTVCSFLVFTYTSLYIWSVCYCMCYRELYPTIKFQV